MEDHLRPPSDMVTVDLERELQQNKSETKSDSSPVEQIVNRSVLTCAAGLPWNSEVFRARLESFFFLEFISAKATI